MTSKNIQYSTWDYVLRDQLVLLRWEEAQNRDYPIFPGDVTPGLFATSNDKAFDCLLHFLLSKLDATTSSEMFHGLWPIHPGDRSARPKFRSASFKWLKSLEKGEGLPSGSVPKTQYEDEAMKEAKRLGPSLLGCLNLQPSHYAGANARGEEIVRLLARLAALVASVDSIRRHGAQKMDFCPIPCRKLSQIPSRISHNTQLAHASERITDCKDEINQNFEELKRIQSYDRDGVYKEALQLTDVGKSAVQESFEDESFDFTEEINVILSFCEEVHKLLSVPKSTFSKQEPKATIHQETFLQFRSLKTRIPQPIENQLMMIEEKLNKGLEVPLSAFYTTALAGLNCLGEEVMKHLLKKDDVIHLNNALCELTKNVTITSSKSLNDQRQSRHILDFMEKYIRACREMLTTTDDPPASPSPKASAPEVPTTEELLARFDAVLAPPSKDQLRKLSRLDRNANLRNEPSGTTFAAEPSVAIDASVVSKDRPSFEFEEEASTLSVEDRDLDPNDDAVSVFSVDSDQRSRIAFKSETPFDSPCNNNGTNGNKNDGTTDSPSGVARSHDDVFSPLQGASVVPEDSFVKLGSISNVQITESNSRRWSLLNSLLTSDDGLAEQSPMSDYSFLME